MLVARRANVLRILDRLGTEQTTGGREDGETPKTKRACSVRDDAEALLFSPIRMAVNLRERGVNEACRKRQGVVTEKRFRARSGLL